MKETNTKFNRRAFLMAAGATGMGTLLAACNQNKDLSAKSAMLTGIGREGDQDLYPIYNGEKYIAKDFSALTKNTELGLSPEIIEHHLGLYQNYIAKVNQAEQYMRNYTRGEINADSLKNLAFSLNGMALHDIYFSNMTTEKTKRSRSLNHAIESSYGSVKNYIKNLTNIARQVKGWSLSCVNLLNGEIINYGLDDHSANFPNFVVPILALDVYEHAYVADFGTDGINKYIKIFKNTIDWDLVSRRYDRVTA